MSATARRFPLGLRGSRKAPASVVVHLVAVFAVCLLSLGVLIGVTSASSFQRERDRAVAQVRSSAQLAAAGLGSQLTSLPTFLQAIAVQPAIASYDPVRCSPAIAGYAKFGLGYVSLVRPDGSVVCTSEPKALALTRPFAGTDYLAKVLASGQPVNGEVTRNPLDQRPAFVEAVAVTGPGGQQGALVGLLDPAFLSLGSNAPLGVRNLEVLVVDPARSVVLMGSGADTRLIGTSLAGQPLSHAIIPGTGTKGPDGRSRIYADATVSGAGWHVLAGIPTGQALAGARTELWRSLALGLAMLVIVLLLGLLLYRRLARPLANLTVAIERARRGQTSMAPVQGPRELAQVAEAFNGMISERQAFEVYLAQLAIHDPLTGLPNRTFVLDQLEFALGRAEEAGDIVAAAFLDLDRFKLVNDSHGHAAGDHVLVALGERLRLCLNAGESVARFGGDEFVVVCDPLLEDVATLAKRVTGALVEPFSYEGQEIFLSGSVGLSLSGLGQSPEVLLAEADAAMYRAKALGRACYVVFDEFMRDQARGRLATEAGLHRALERHEFVLHYQPQLSLSRGLVVGAEALVRWRHPERGLLAPAQFIDVAEETGLIIPIGEWVLREACTQAAAWCRSRAVGGAPVISVNLSARQLAQRGLPALVAQILAESGLEPGQLCLEITESLLIEDAEAAANVLRGLKDLGVLLSIDDFGTGYSSLSYLQRYPIDQLKIDKSFVGLLHEESVDGAIVHSIIDLAHSLNIEVVAEGVETLHQIGALRRLGCDVAQGYYIGRPQEAEKLETMLDDDTRSHSYASTIT